MFQQQKPRPFRETWERGARRPGYRTGAMIVWAIVAVWLIVQLSPVVLYSATIAPSGTIVDSATVDVSTLPACEHDDGASLVYPCAWISTRDGTMTGRETIPAVVWGADCLTINGPAGMVCYDARVS
jgi:hypothetical protein